MTIVLGDADLDRVPVMRLALEAIEAAMVARAGGSLIAPARHTVGFPGHGDMTFTIGGSIGSGGVAGFRVYERFAGPVHRQLIAVWATDSARLEGLVVGERLGNIRTGAIGGVAIRHMSAPDASIVGLVGTGTQARTQLAAAAAVRPLQDVRVFSRDAAKCARFAREMTQQLDLPIRAVASARAAVDGADIVLCATISPTPVIELAWLKPGVHINTVASKTVGAHEVGVDIAEGADLIATDSPEQTRAYSKPFFLAGTAANDRMADLADIVTGKLPGRQSGTGMSLFCSQGLAGTEVFVAARVLAAFRSAGLAPIGVDAD